MLFILASRDVSRENVFGPDVSTTNSEAMFTVYTLNKNA